MPTQVRIATITQALALWKAQDAPLGVAGFADFGVIRMRSVLHPSAVALLEQFRKHSVKL